MTLAIGTATSGSTSFFSCEYRPGATKAQTCHSTTGKAIRKAAISVILSGTTKGEITLVAISVALPMLVVFSVFVGWFGGALVSMSNEKIAISFHAYISNLRDVVDIGDLANGLFKSLCFAIAIGIVSCHQGLQTIGGPRGIGRSVTKAVVNSIVMILILDYFLTRLLLCFEK